MKIICVGKLKEKYFSDAVEEYQKRLSKYTKLELIEVKDEDLKEEKKTLALEEERILKYLNDKDYVITLEIEGKELSSIEFSKKIDQILIENSNVTFVIGGSYGLSENIKKRANLHLSFSKMTFPHQLFRILLLEQIYRSYKIINNERYHK